MLDPVYFSQKYEVGCKMVVIRRTFHGGVGKGDMKSTRA